MGRPGGEGNGIAMGWHWDDIDGCGKAMGWHWGEGLATALLQQWDGNAMSSGPQLDGNGIVVGLQWDGCGAAIGWH